MTKTVHNAHRRLWQQSNDRAGALKAAPAAIPAACIADPKSPRSPTRKDSRSYILPILVLERPSRFPFRWIAPRRYAMRRPSRFGIPSRTASADGRFGEQNALRPRRRLRKAAPRRGTDGVRPDSRGQGRFAATGRVRRPKPSRAAVSAMAQRARSKAASSPPVIQNKHHSVPYSIGVKTFRQARSKRQARRRICRKRQMRFCLV